MSTISVQDFESKVLAVEEIVLVVRAPASIQVDDYNYDRKAAGNTSISDWLATRVIPKIGGLECLIIDGMHNPKPHGRTKLSTLRDSYVK